MIDRQLRKKEREKEREREIGREKEIEKERERNVQRKHIKIGFVDCGRTLEFYTSEIRYLKRKREICANEREIGRQIDSQIERQREGETKRQKEREKEREREFFEKERKRG